MNDINDLVEKSYNLKMTAIYHLTVPALLIGGWIFLTKMAISQMWNRSDSAYEAFGFFFTCSSPPYSFSLSLLPWDREKWILCIYLPAGVNVHICGELFLVAARFTDTLFLLREVVKYLKVTHFSRVECSVIHLIRFWLSRHSLERAEGSLCSFRLIPAATKSLLIPVNCYIF